MNVIIQLWATFWPVALSGCAGLAILDFVRSFFQRPRPILGHPGWFSQLVVLSEDRRMEVLSAATRKLLRRPSGLLPGLIQSLFFAAGITLFTFLEKGLFPEQFWLATALASGVFYFGFFVAACVERAFLRPLILQSLKEMKED